MLTEDYIMRLISQALAVVTTALGLKKKRKYAEAMQSFEQAKEILLGLDAHMIDLLEDAAVIDRLISRDKLDVERAGLLADIYSEEGELYDLTGQIALSEFAIQRSLRLYLETVLSTEGEMSLEIILKIDALRQRIPASKLNQETCLALLDYLERLIGSTDELLASGELSRSKLRSDFSVLTPNCDAG
jgi:hypothetical protein